MRNIWSSIRTSTNDTSKSKKIIFSVSVMCLGIILGAVSKYFDNTASNELPNLISILDLRNFFSRFAVWVLLAVCISVYSKTPVRSAINVFVFFGGMISSYYLYSNYISGFFPRSYALIWVGFTILSPVLAYICWYAKGQGKIAILLSAGIVAILFNMTFSYGLFYINIISPLEFIVFLITIVILRRNLKETVIMLGSAGIIAIIFEFVSTFIPFHIF